MSTSTISMPHMQGTVFTAAAIGGRLHVLAAHGTDTYAAALEISGISDGKSLAKRGTVDAVAPPAANAMLNYLHSACHRFPLDDCLRIAAAEVERDRPHCSSAAPPNQARGVNVHIVTGEEHRACFVCM